MEKIKKIITELNQDYNIKENLILLKQLLKEVDINQVKPIINIDVIIKLLQNDQMKVKKNVLIIIKTLNIVELNDYLIDMYFREDNWIVKAELINTLTSFNIKDNNVVFNKILDQLPDDSINAKHIETIKTKIHTCQLDENQEHVFLGLKKPTDIILTTLSDLQGLVYDRLDVQLKKIVSIGVLARVEQLDSIKNIRNYNELLFPMKKIKNIGFETEQLATAICSSELLQFLKETHNNLNLPFRFRIDSQRINPERLKNDFIQKLGLKIQYLSQGQLLNSPSNYEVEIRLVETSKQTCQVFLKLYTLKDRRFEYRKETLATSIQPYVAATIADLIYPYTQENADILDLCCGTGTMLIEREYVNPCHFKMGLDIYGVAIKKAKFNTELAHQTIHYIQKDFERFEHRHQFDEIISNLPIQSGQKDRKEIEKLYQDFLRKSNELLKRNGYLFVYTGEPEVFKKSLRFNKQNFELVKEVKIKIRKKENVLFILNHK